MEDFPQQQKKTFTPIILFNDYHYASSSVQNKNNGSSSAQYHQSLLEKHLEVTKKRLEINARIWEDIGRQPAENQQLKAHNNILTQPVSNICNEAVSHSLNESSNYCDSSMHTSSSSLWPNSHVPHTSISSNNSGASEFKPNTHCQTIILDVDRYNEDNRQQHPSREDNRTAYITTNFPFVSEHQHCTSYEAFLNTKKRRENLPKEATEYLKKWLILHKKHPYPTDTEKKQLADETRLHVNQISNWFINARRRILQPILQSESNRQERRQQENQERQEHQEHHHQHQQLQRNTCLNIQHYPPSTSDQPSSYSDNAIQTDQFASSNNVH